MSEDNAEYNVEVATDDDGWTDTYDCGCCMCCGCDCMWDDPEQEDLTEEEAEGNAEDDLDLSSIDDMELPDIDMTTYDQADNENNECSGGGCAI